MQQSLDEMNTQHMDVQERLLLTLSLDVQNIKASVTNSTDTLTRQMSDLAADMRVYRDDRTTHKYEMEALKSKLVAHDRLHADTDMRISSINNKMQGIDLVDFGKQLKEMAARLEDIVDAQKDASLKRTTILGLGKTTWSVVGAILGTTALIIALGEKLHLIVFP